MLWVFIEELQVTGEPQPVFQGPPSLLLSRVFQESPLFWIVLNLRTTRVSDYGANGQEPRGHLFL